MTGSEHEEQVALFEWAAWQHKKYPELELMFAIPNGGQRHVVVAMKLKAEGVKPGVPDIFLPVARNIKLRTGSLAQYNGLFIEMKAEKGRLTEKQKEWLDKLDEQGYATAECYGADEAIKVLEWYLQK